MAGNSQTKGTKSDSSFSKSKKGRPNAQATYEVKKAEALASQFPPAKPDPDETT